jgi:hypothetical protein
VAVEPSNKSIPQTISELWELTKDYARQETVDPLKGVARYVAFGVGGALLGAIGVVMLMLAMLRALQTETNLTGNWSWAPYALVLLAGLLLIAIAVARINRK